MDTLATLPERELRAGLAEVIKHGAIRDAALFAWLEANVERLVARDAEALAHAVQRSVEIKAEVVALDERETGARALLNFGHTFGHAIEAGLGYGTWLHGEAVAAGMVMAAELSARLGMLDAAVGGAPAPSDRARRAAGRRAAACRRALHRADVGRQEGAGRTAPLHPARAARVGRHPRRRRGRALRATPRWTA